MPRALTELAGLDRTATGRHASRLDAAGLVERQVDGTATLLVVTSKASGRWT